MRLNFYSRRRRFNKSLLGSHKNSLTLTKKPKTCDLSSYACWVAAVATLYATYPIAFRLRNRKGLRHSMFALILQVGTCRALHSECVPSHSFTQKSVHSVYFKNKSERGATERRQAPTGRAEPYRTRSYRTAMLLLVVEF